MPFLRARDPEDAPKTAPDPASNADQVRRDLHDHDPDTRRAAVRQAVRMGEMTLLAERLEHEPASAIRETILTGLLRNGTLAAARPLIPYLQSEDALLRNAVVETLQGMGDVVIPEIERLLDNPDSDVRIFAMNIVASLRSPQAPDLALKVIASDSHVNVCAAAVDVLAEVGRADMADALRDVATRFPAQPFLAFAVRAALKRIG